MTNNIQPMPELDPEQYDALVADIVANGVLVPVIKDQHGRILDGNNRARSGSPDPSVGRFLP